MIDLVDLFAQRERLFRTGARSPWDRCRDGEAERPQVHAWIGPLPEGTQEEDAMRRLEDRAFLRDLAARRRRAR